MRRSSASNSATTLRHRKPQVGLPWASTTVGRRPSAGGPHSATAIRTPPTSIQRRRAPDGNSASSHGGSEGAVMPPERTWAWKGDGDSRRRLRLRGGGRPVRQASTPGRRAGATSRRRRRRCDGDCRHRSCGRRGRRPGGHPADRDPCGRCRAWDRWTDHRGCHRPAHAADRNRYRHHRHSRHRRRRRRDGARRWGAIAATRGSAATAGVATTAAAARGRPGARRRAEATARPGRAAERARWAAGASRVALPRLVDAELTSIEVGTIELLQRRLSLLGRRHLDEGEAARATCLSIDDDGDAGYLAAVAAEERAQRLLVGVVVQVAHIELRTHGLRRLLRASLRICGLGVW